MLLRNENLDKIPMPSSHSLVYNAPTIRGPICTRSGVGAWVIRLAIHIDIPDVVMTIFFVMAVRGS